MRPDLRGGLPVSPKHRGADVVDRVARAVANAALPDDLHVHDLRHTGKRPVPERAPHPGELMNRMGHSSTRAARINLYAREERERQLAATLDKMARRELNASAAKRTASRSGT